jgi:hypothetical protein
MQLLLLLIASPIEDSVLNLCSPALGSGLMEHDRLSRWALLQPERLLRNSPSASPDGTQRVADVRAPTPRCLGDWVTGYGEHAYEARYRQAIELTSLDYQTLR